MKYVYVIDKNNIVQQQRVETGDLQEDGLRVIDSGLHPGEWVVIGAIQQVRPRMQITPDREPMPTLGTLIEGSSASSGNPPAGSSGGSEGSNSPAAGAKSTDTKSPDKTSPAAGSSDAKSTESKSTSPDGKSTQSDDSKAPGATPALSSPAKSD
jgi:multidrug efflux system membrane fusion protein